MRRFLALLSALAFCAPAAAEAGRVGVGVAPGASLDEVAALVEARTGVPVERDEGLRALFLDAEQASDLRDLRGVSYVEPLDAIRRLSFTPNDPLLARQWYVRETKAFDFWPQAPSLPGLKVAVIDSGIDAGHPELARRIAAGKSFVGGDWRVDKQGHGTFVAGEIAAATGNAQGIAGIAFPAQLLVAKVVKENRSIPLEAEVKAIRWAVDSGAQVINLSLSGVRDPLNPKRDSYSQLEAAAVAYAFRKGVLVVASVGNGDQAPQLPWDYAGWPAALPHVLSVSALGRDGSVPSFSNRDDFYNDLAAPGEEILSTLPRALTAARPSCLNQGYSDCGNLEYRRAEGTSFAAPQVAAAAALLWSAKPLLRPEQVAGLLTRTASDLREIHCRGCLPGHDRLSGWGRLNIQQALVQAVYGEAPEPDRFETNDDAGDQAWKLWGAASKRTLTATLDFYDDQIDVYSIMVKKGQRLSASLRGPALTDANLVLWRPGTKHVEDPSKQQLRAATSAKGGWIEQITNYRARVAGRYFIEVKLSAPGDGAYSLSITRK